MAIASDTHDVYAWGWNKFGQCGASPGVNGPHGVKVPSEVDITGGVDNPGGVNSSAGVNIPSGAKVAGGVNPPGGNSPSVGFEALSEPRRLMELDDGILVGDDSIR